MQECAIVKKVAGQTATLVIDKKDECSKCGMCLFPKGANAIEFEAVNRVNAKEGDTVLIDRQEKGKLTAILLVFLVPLLLILLSSVIALTVIRNELWALWLSLISLAVWFILLAFLDKRLKRTKGFTTTIVKIIETSEKEKENE